MNNSNLILLFLIIFCIIIYKNNLNTKSNYIEDIEKCNSCLYLKNGNFRKCELECK